MSVVRTIRDCAAVALIGSALVTVAAQPAAAAVNPATCNYVVLTDQTISATCTNTNQSAWTLRIGCENSNGVVTYHNGTNVVYGSGTAKAHCAQGTDYVDWYAVNL